MYGSGILRNTRQIVVQVQGSPCDAGVDASFDREYKMFDIDHSDDRMGDTAHKNEGRAAYRKAHLHADCNSLGV